MKKNNKLCLIPDLGASKRQTLARSSSMDADQPKSESPLTV